MRYLILILISIFSFLVYASLPPTRLKGGNESALATTFNFDVGAIPVTRTGTSVVFGTLPVSGGGTGLTSLTAYNLLSGSGTTVNQIAPAASGTILFSTGASSFPTFRSLVNLDVTTALGYTPIASSAASIAEVLGYVPLASSTAAIKSTLGYEPVASVSSTAPITITGGTSNPVIGLSPSGVVSGTYPKVTVDSFGRVTSGSALNNADVVTGLGYTPVASVTASSPITITGGASNPVISLDPSGVTSGSTHTKVRVDGYGRVVFGTTLVETDIPNLQTTKITSGVFTVAFGGTGVSTTSTGALLIGSGTTTYTTLPASTTGTYLTMGATSPVWTAVAPASTTLSNVVTLTASTTLTTSNDMVFVTPGSVTLTITLPNAASGTGKIITVQKTDIAPGSVLISTQGGQTIDGASTTRLDVKLESVKLISDGSNWSVLNREFLVPIASKYRVSVVQTSSPTQPLNYDTVIFDDLSLVITGASWNFKAPKTGIYQACVTFVDPGIATYMSIYVNAALTQLLSTVVAASEPSSNCNFIRVNKNDLIDARSAVSMTLNSTSIGTHNNISISFVK